jgi:methyltransferase OMS1, mitochondrial
MSPSSPDTVNGKKRKNLNSIVTGVEGEMGVKAAPTPRKPITKPKPSSPVYIPPPRKQPPLAAYKPPLRSRWRFPLGIIVFTAAGFLTLSGVRNARSSPAGEAADVPEDVSNRYHTTAQRFDSQVGVTEMLMGLNWRRARMAREAAGHVLEMGVGTARNSRYYKLDKCNSITMIDQAPEMIDIARAKFQSTCGRNGLRSRSLLISSIEEHPSYQNCRFVVQSVHDPIQHPSEGFDTVIQTMGICSTANPANALRRLGAITNPQHGRILLLEHGRSHYEWLNDYLDKHASFHADKYGCWWNKDIGKIARESGLEVVRIQRYNFGTTWWVELKPRPSP